MGNFLDTPLTEKTTEISEDAQKNVWVGMSCMQGWRAQMEDDHVISLSLPQAMDVSLFGVFDGHGGDHVAHYTAKHVERHLVNAKDFGSSPRTLDALQSAFREAILALDAELRVQPEYVNGHDQSGSTLTMVAITPEAIVCANTGDSRSVLCRAGQAIDLSNDHKPSLDEEKNRIEHAGGHVKFNRVNGDLAVSRALGDFAYKQRDDLPAEAQAVTALPELKSEPRSAADEFVLLACDGVWDVLSSQECCTFVSNLLRASERPAAEKAGAATGADTRHARAASTRDWDLGAVSEALLDHCLHKGSRDNMSVIIVALNSDFATGTAARRRGAMADAPSQPSKTDPPAGND
jgi:serine/threonine protein phosphatase PrpC